MDFISALNDLIWPISGIILGWLGFLEKRFRDMRNELEARIESKNQINEIVQSNLKESIVRLESKIDMLIQLQIGRGRDGANQD